LTSQLNTFLFPTFVIGGGYSQLGPAPALSQIVRDSWSGQFNASTLVGRHLWSAGWEGRQYHDNARTPGYASGRYVFSKGYTQADAARADAISGDELASFLLGYPNGATVDSNIDPAFDSRYVAAFVQDAWRVNSRLMVTFGLRYDYERPYRERFNRMWWGFDLEAPSPLAPRVSSLNLKGLPRFAGVAGASELAFVPDRNNF
jgi:outer membrane receptor protein involved in Fe transport